MILKLSAWILPWFIADWILALVNPIRKHWRSFLIIWWIFATLPKPYSAAEFRHDAIEAAEKILKAGKKPLLVGGTMLYFKVLRDGLAQMPAANPQARLKIQALAEQSGWEAVHKRLAEVDPEVRHQDPSQ